MLFARCRDPEVPVDHSWFFPARGSKGQRAKKICDECPVVAECDEYASRTGSEGVWGARVHSQRGKSQRM